MADTGFDEWIAAHYEVLWPEIFDPAVLEPAVDFLARLADHGPALEFGIGTGRLAVPLARTGVPVQGIELSPAMAARVPREIRVTQGDFATTRVAGQEGGPERQACGVRTGCRPPGPPRRGRVGQAVGDVEPAEVGVVIPLDVGVVAEQPL